MLMPHVTKTIAGRPVRGEAPAMAVSERDLRLVRDGMWAVVNEADGTAHSSKLPAGFGVMAGKTGSVQVRRVTREQRERGLKTENLPREYRPHALFVAFAPYDNPQYAVSVIVEHGNSGAGAAGPLARDIMVDTINHFRNPPAPAARVADARPATPAVPPR
jgi:penicillin-binding protein 2